jgi:hypothetical protein
MQRVVSETKERFYLEPDYFVGAGGYIRIHRLDLAAALIDGKRRKRVLRCHCDLCSGSARLTVNKSRTGVGCTTFNPKNLALIKAWALEDRTGGGGQ